VSVELSVEPLSVLVPTLNEEECLPECLASCAFADEIVVVDSGSEDRTVEIAREHGATVLVHAFETHARQKNWGLTHVSHSWVLVVEADERVPTPLRDEIREVLRGPARRGYWIRRRNTFLGRGIRGSGWQHDRVLRLFDRTVGRYEERRVHEEVRVRGQVGVLKQRLIHHSCRDLSAWIRKTERYSTLGAEEAWASGRRATGGDLLFRPVARFLKQYVAQGGFRDGVEGLMLCTVSAFGVFLKYAKLKELAMRNRETGAR
jgi:glycosyltransferase involved in cell wall biosynthesis